MLEWLKREISSLDGYFRHLRQTIYATFLRILSTGMTLLFAILCARLMGEKIFGTYVTLFSLAGVISVATSVGLPGLFQREMAASRSTRDRSYVVPIAQWLLLITAALLVATIGSFFMAQPEIGLMILFCLFAQLGAFVNSLFLAYERVVLVSFFEGVLRPASALLALVVLSAALVPSPLIPLGAQVLGVGIAGGSLLLFWRGEPLSRSLRALRHRWWSEHHSPVAKASVTFAITQVLVNLTFQADVLILSYNLAPEEVGYYYAAIRACLVINFFFGASALIAEPTLTRLHADGATAEFQMLAARTAMIGAFVTILAAIVATILAPWYLGIYGPAFTVAFPSFCVVAAGLAIQSLFGPSASILRAVRGEQSLLKITAMVLVVNCAITGALVPFMGMLGAAIGTAAQFVIYGVLLARACKSSDGGYRSGIFYPLGRRLQLSCSSRP
ncbi:oligosaccharide flippase family protein [Novosphingobium aquae]|uniref:Oligosaccharide flippase family protein n=1 Tax=Novosphingobium aquae TaxID=3133435 RepID=A0ABU8SFZ1_9SPHN